MEVTDRDFRDIIWQDHEDFETITPETLEDQSRWSVYKSRVFRQVSTGKYFEAYWGEGATEIQDGQTSDWSFTEVEPFEVTVTRYRTKPGGEMFEGTI